jgi:hypothetical protein
MERRQHVQIDPDQLEHFAPEIADEEWIAMGIPWRRTMLSKQQWATVVAM